MVAHVRAPLFVPANRPDRFVKAAQSGADAVILDLEDAVAASDKDAARDALDAGFTSLPVFVRINACGTIDFSKDVAAVARLPLAGIMLPKAEDPNSATQVAAVTGKPVIALIESARGLANARAIAGAEGVERLAFGSIDFCADLGCQHLRELLLPVRLELVMASRLARIAAPMDGVTVTLDDPSVSHDDALHARAMGMGGKLCIHPKQVEVILNAFAPSQTEIEWARRVLATAGGAVSMGGEMVDEPVRIRARAILDGAPVARSPEHGP